MAHIILKCIKENGKLRIKFDSYVDINGKKHKDVYNNNLNCRFPKNIREEGRYYKISPEDLKITSRSNSVPFYSVKGKSVKIINVLETVEVYKAAECVCCMDARPDITLLPCGHHCTCQNCYEIMRHKHNSCPLCRIVIKQAHINNN